MAEKAYVSPRGLQSTKTRLLRGAFGILAFTVTIGGSLYSQLLGDAVYYFVLALVLLSAVTLFIVLRPERFRWYRLPAPVFLFLLVTAVSLFWVNNFTRAVLTLLFLLVLTVIAIAIAYLLTWAETLRTLGVASRYLLGVALLVWFWHSVITKRHSVIAKNSDLATTDSTVSGVASLESSPLELISVIALCVFTVQTAAGFVRPPVGIFWSLVAVAAVIVANSVITYSAVAVVVITLLFLLWARKSKADTRMPMYFIGMLILAATIFVLYWWRANIFPAVGIEIDAALSDSVWFTVWRNEGVIGGILFLLLVFVTTWRVWFRAVDQPRRGAGPPLDYAKSALWPALVTMSLLVFSFLAAPSVLLPGWFLLVLFAVKTRFDYIVPSKAEDQKRLAWRDVPLAETHNRSMIGD